MVVVTNVSVVVDDVLCKLIEVTGGRWSLVMVDSGCFLLILLIDDHRRRGVDRCGRGCVQKNGDGRW